MTEYLVIAAILGAVVVLGVRALRRIWRGEGGCPGCSSGCVPPSADDGSASADDGSATHLDVGD